MTGSKRRGRALAVSAALLCVAVGREAVAQEGWGSTPDLVSGVSTTGNAIYAPKVGVDAAGNAIALWTEPGPPNTGAATVVRAARFDVATGRWGAPSTLSRGEPMARAVDVAVDAAGNAVAVWNVSFVGTIAIGYAARYDCGPGESLTNPASQGPITHVP